MSWAQAVENHYYTKAFPYNRVLVSIESNELSLTIGKSSGHRFFRLNTSGSIVDL